MKKNSSKQGERSEVILSISNINKAESSKNIVMRDKYIPWS